MKFADINLNGTDEEIKKQIAEIIQFTKNAPVEQRGNAEELNEFFQKAFVASDQKSIKVMKWLVEALVNEKMLPKFHPIALMVKTL